jgi:FKBP-type peptidyl-prolyl cis-trans isomerase FklB
LNVWAAKLFKNPICIIFANSHNDGSKIYIMKKTMLAVVVFAGLTAPVFAYDTNVLSDEKSKISYAIGMTIGHNFQQQGIDVDDAVFLRGLKDAQSGGATLLTMQEMQVTLKEFQQGMAAKQAKLRAGQALTNKLEGDAFLATNKSNPGVITLPDGLQYKVITAGTGAKPTTDATVTVNYRGTFIDGTEFDSSAKSGHPMDIQANHVIPGWTEALTNMPAGSKWQLFIPSELAYAERGNRGIPPNAALLFDLELLAVKATPPPPPTAPLTSDIIKVPSAEEMKKGAKIETLKPEDVQRLQLQTQTNK